MTNSIDFCLLAIGGDCSAHGMGDVPDFIPLERDDEGLVRDYLANELDRSFVVAFQHDDGKKYRRYWSSPETLLDEHFRLGNDLIERGIFHHKWHLRTEWALWSMSDGMPVNIATANACYKGASRSVRRVAEEDAA